MRFKQISAITRRFPCFNWAQTLALLRRREIKISRAFAASALLLALLFFGALLVAIGSQELSEAQRERDAEAELLASLQQARGDENNKAAESEADHENPFVAAASETLAAAELDRLLRDVAAASNGAVLSSRTEAKHDEDSPARRLQAEMIIEGDIEAIQAALFAIETSTPFIFVEALDLHPADEAARERASNAAPRLRAALTMEAYWKGPLGASDAPSGAGAGEGRTKSLPSDSARERGAAGDPRP